MSCWMFFLLVLLLLILQVGVLPILFTRGPVPNILLAGIIWMLFQLSLRRSLLAAMLGGGIVDIFSGLPMGSHSMSLIGATVLIYALLAVLVPKEKTFLVLSGSVVAAYTAHQLFLFITAWFFHQVNRGLDFQIGQFINSASLTGLLVMVTSLYVLEWLGRAMIRLRYE